MVTANGTEPGRDDTVAFSLREGKLDGALLTGTKVFSDGRAEPFEAVFIERTTVSNQTPGPEKVFGLGVVYGSPRQVDDHGFATDKLFYELK